MFFCYGILVVMRKKDIIVLGGYPGSGKSTVRKILAEKLGYKSFSAGDFSRKLAEDRGMSIEELNEYIATKGEELDHLIDEEQQRIEKEENEYVVDAHIGFHFIPSGFKVFLMIPIETSAERIFADRDAEVRVKSGDSMGSYEEALERTKKRIENHKMRYKKHYGINVYDVSQFDLVIDNSDMEAEEVATEIIAAFEKWRVL